MGERRTPPRRAPRGRRVSVRLAASTDAGDQDYICNWLGNQAWTQAMPWPHRTDFVNAAPTPWMVDSKAAGTLQTSNGFSFLRVYDAGHMVPRDQPANALAMLNAFIAGDI
jgi:cathepsin A (carboxypeptidase C)